MNKTASSHYLATEKISRLLLRFSIPCILSLVISALYNIVDQIFIGNSSLGYLGNAATGVVFPVTIIALSFAWAFGDGTAAYMSICQGRKDSRSASRCVGSALTVTFVISCLLLIVFWLFPQPILHLFGATDKTIDMATSYFRIVILMMPFYMLMNTMTSIIRADGSPIISMVSILSGAVLNIVLDPIFIYVLKMGIEGAAYATIIGQFVSFIVATSYFFRTKTFKLTWRSFWPDFEVFLNAIKLGLSTFITQISIVVVSLVCNMSLVKYGSQSIYGADIPISVISIETKVYTIVINIVVGIVLGGQPIIGYNYGAKDMVRVKKTLKLILITTAVVGLISTIIFEFFPEAIINLFGKGDDLYQEFAVKTFRIFLSLILFTCIIKMSSIFFQAVGQPIKAMVASLARDLLCFIPLVIILPQSFGIDGILMAGPISDAIAIIITTGFFIQFFREINSVKKDASLADEV